MKKEELGVSSFLKRKEGTPGRNHLKRLLLLKRKLG